VSRDLDNPLLTAHRVALVGDLHGDLQHLLLAAATAWARGASELIALGDWGFIWPGEPWNRALDKISKRLASRGMTMYVVDGNHEWHPALNSFAVDDDGLRRLRQNVLHMPRGQRMTLSSGRTLAVMGGANSIDRDLRVEGTSWWPEEAITEEDLTALGDRHADILLGHDAPLDLPDLDRELTVEKYDWPWSVIQYAEEGRRMFDRGFRAVRPRLSVSGHYHRFLDVEKSFGDPGDEFVCRAVVLDQGGNATNIAHAVLDVETLDLQFFTRGDRAVTQLTDRDHGNWIVTTRHSAHAFALDDRTVERRPGPDALRGSIDRPLPLNSIEVIRVGERGLWYLGGDDDHPGGREYLASTVRRIERVARL
jgi:hypothetical protein